jgi:hypothetical protein
MPACTPTRRNGARYRTGQPSEWPRRRGRCPRWRLVQSIGCRICHRPGPRGAARVRPPGAARVAARRGEASLTAAIKGRSRPGCYLGRAAVTPAGAILASVLDRGPSRATTQDGTRPDGCAGPGRQPQRHDSATGVTTRLSRPPVIAVVKRPAPARGSSRSAERRARAPSGERRRQRRAPPARTRAHPGAPTPGT